MALRLLQHTVVDIPTNTINQSYSLRTTTPEHATSLARAVSRTQHAHLAACVVCGQHAPCAHHCAPPTQVFAAQVSWWHLWYGWVALGLCWWWCGGEGGSFAACQSSLQAGVADFAGGLPPWVPAAAVPLLTVRLLLPALVVLRSLEVLVRGPVLMLLLLVLATVLPGASAGRLVLCAAQAAVQHVPEAVFVPLPALRRAAAEAVVAAAAAAAAAVAALPAPLLGALHWAVCCDCSSCCSLGDCSVYATAPLAPAGR